MLTEITTDIYQVPIPIPFPLKTVNCYLVREPDGWAIVDTGMNTPQAVAAWNAAFTSLGATVADVRRIYLTHFHPDHFGLAGYLQQLSQAAVHMLDLEAEKVEQFWGDERRMWPAFAEHWRRHGMPADVVGAAVEHERGIISGVRPFPRITPLEDGQDVTLAGRPYRVLWMPGHSDGHAVFYGLDNRVLFAGDNLLLKITPNIGLWPFSDPNPLRSFVRTLHRLDALDVNLVLPGHRAVFRDMHGRIAELLYHHTQRAAHCEAMTNGGDTAFTISRGVFGEHLSVHDRRFALAETLAHLEYLRMFGRVERSENGLVTYRRPSSRQDGRDESGASDLKL